MKIDEIKKAIDEGKKVFWASQVYPVIKDKNGEYLITCSLNGHCIGLHGKPGTKYENVMNGRESEFFIKN